MSSASIENIRRESVSNQNAGQPASAIPLYRKSCENPLQNIGLINAINKVLMVLLEPLELTFILLSVEHVSSGSASSKARFNFRVGPNHNRDALATMLIMFFTAENCRTGVSYSATDDTYQLVIDGAHVEYMSKDTYPKYSKQLVFKKLLISCINKQADLRSMMISVNNYYRDGGKYGMYPKQIKIDQLYAMDLTYVEKIAYGLIDQ